MSAPPEPITHRFAPAHSAAERKVSTAERFGIGRSAGPAGLASQPTPGAVAVALEPDPVVEPETDSFAGPFREPRIGAGRPLRGRPVAAEPEFDLEWESAFEADAAHEYADSASGDPITAPVAAVDLLDFDGGSEFDDLGDLDAGDAGLAGAADQVLIRTGQAGTPESPAQPSRKARSAADDRPARPGRLKLRRRPPGSS